MTLTLDLPMPPSVNKIWSLKGGKNGVYVSKPYKKWREEANALCMQFRWHKERIAGPFAVWVTLDRAQRNGDLDNRLKAILDFLHTAGITDDDSYCEALGADWGHAPVGCRVMVDAWSEDAQLSKGAA